MTVVALLLAATADAFSGRALTLYLDGAQVEQRESARKGYLEIIIPPGAVKESLRISPGKGVEILRVVTIPLKPGKSVENELLKLAEREDILNDRLKALSVREDIFKSAAKSQSAKAPRRTKTNPEPLSTIKQGTDYAITQLESVYHAKRKTEKELAQIADRRARIGKSEQSGGAVARVWTTPASGSVTASWIQGDRSWQPVYQLRIDGNDKAFVTMMSPGVTLAKGETADLALSLVKSGGAPLKFRYEGEWASLRREEFKAVDTINTEPTSSLLTINLANLSGINFPPGEISCFRRGVYIGSARFPGAEAGKQVVVSCSR
jgi:hypothetical protein